MLILNRKIASNDKNIQEKIAHDIFFFAYYKYDKYDKQLVILYDYHTGIIGLLEGNQRAIRRLSTFKFTTFGIQKMQ